MVIYACHLEMLITTLSSVSKSLQRDSMGHIVCDTGFKHQFKQSGFVSVEFQCQEPACVTCAQLYPEVTKHHSISLAQCFRCF